MPMTIVAHLYAECLKTWKDWELSLDAQGQTTT